jgi:hypothetical protein
MAVPHAATASTSQLAATESPDGQAVLQHQRTNEKHRQSDQYKINLVPEAPLKPCGPSFILMAGMPNRVFSGT